MTIIVWNSLIDIDIDILLLNGSFCLCFTSYYLFAVVRVLFVLDSESPGIDLDMLPYKIVLYYPIYPPFSLGKSKKEMENN